MKTTRQNLILPWLIVMLMASLLLLSSCASRTQTVLVIPADRTIKALPSGNYEVTPAWLQERYHLERYQAEKLKACK